MHWILLIAVLGIRGNAVATADFADEKACKAAAALFVAAIKDESYVTTARAICVPKGSAS